jgi:hypothetical protein
LAGLSATWQTVGRRDQQIAELQLAQHRAASIQVSMHASQKLAAEPSSFHIVIGTSSSPMKAEQYAQNELRTIRPPPGDTPAIEAGAEFQRHALPLRSLSGAGRPPGSGQTGRWPVTSLTLSAKTPRISAMNCAWSAVRTGTCAR